MVQAREEFRLAMEEKLRHIAYRELFGVRDGGGRNGSFRNCRSTLR